MLLIIHIDLPFQNYSHNINLVIFRTNTLAFLKLNHQTMIEEIFDEIQT